MMLHHAPGKLSADAGSEAHGESLRDPFLCSRQILSGSGRTQPVCPSLTRSVTPISES